jgi:hypothetical protein
VRFAYITSLREDGTRIILSEKKTLPAQELRQRAAKHYRREIMFVAWIVYACLSPTPPNHSDPYRFVPLTDLERTHSL